MALPRGNPAMLSGWSSRKKITVTSTSDIRGDILNLTVHATTGTDVNSTDTLAQVYIGASVRSDWGDLRITKSDGLTVIPHGILRISGTAAYIAFKGDIKNGTTTFYLYYNGPAADVFKIGSTSDHHYGTPDTYADRHLALTFLANFNTRMTAYVPDLIVCNGDNTHYTPTTEATQIGFMTAVFDAVFAGPGGIDKVIVAPGNHDFEYISFTNTRGIIDNYQSWMESGALYGIAYESDDYIFISLDSNYDTGDNTHLTMEHVGYGYIDPTQITWLKTTLAAADKEVIIFCHHPLCEADTEQWTLTKDTYHTRNRFTVRNIIEQSQKVVAVIHGHTHFSRVDIIKGIPYVLTGNLTNDDNFGEVPFDSEGRWDIIELDRSSRMIRARREARLSGTVHTVYDTYIPFGKTSFSTDISNDLESVFKNNYGGWFGKSSIVRDAIQLYVTNDDYLYKFPVNINTPDDTTATKSIRINGRTSNPNFGRSTWGFDVTQGSSVFEFSVFMADASTFYVKFGDSAVSTAPLIYVVFRANGDLIVFNNLTEVSLVGGGDYSLNTWYHFGIYVNTTANTFTVRLNGTMNGTTFSYYNGTTHDAFGQIEIVTEAGDFYLENLRVRKLVATERSMAFA